MKHDLRRRYYILFFGLALAFASTVAAQDPQDAGFPKGKLTEKVLVKDEPSQSYALYLPSSYDPDKKFPIIYCFDPGGRGSVAVEKYRSAAEKYG